MTPLSKVHMMGTKEDLARRKKLRTDDSHRRAKVKQSLDIIYNKGLHVDADKVEDLLQKESWVPNSVSYFGL
jgi:hypothetical protein